MTWRRLGSAVGAALLFLLVPSSAAWAVHAPAPVPSLAPGQGLVGTGWMCHREETAIVTGSTSQQDCQVSAWQVTPAAGFASPVPLPNPLPVSVPTPLPVREVAPVTSGTATLSCADPSTSPSPAPSPSPTAGPSPSPSPGTGCVVAVAADQYNATSFGLGLLVFLTSAAVVGAWRK